MTPTVVAGPPSREPTPRPDSVPPDLSKIRAASVLANAATCPLCLQAFDDAERLPKLLPCLHTVCLLCVRRQEVHDEEESARFHCPLCRRPCEHSATSLPNNVITVGLVGALQARRNDGHVEICDECHEDDQEPAVSRCVECHACLCEIHHNSHKKSARTMSHRLISLDDFCQREFLAARKALHCDVHPAEAINFYCVACQKPICRDCAVGEHGEHKRLTVHEVSETLREKIADMAIDAQKVTKDIDPAVHTLFEMIRSIDERSDAIHTQIKESFAQLRAAVDAREQALLASVDEMLSGRRRAVQSQASMLESSKLWVLSTVEVMRQMAEDGTDAELAALMPHIRHNWADLMALQVRPPPPMEDALVFSGATEELAQAISKHGSVTGYTAAAAYAQAEGAGLREARMGMTAAFQVVMFNKDGTRRVEGGDDVRVALDCPCRVPTRVWDNQDGTYMVSYSPLPEADVFSVAITVNGVPITGSPFRPTLLPERPVSEYRRSLHTQRELHVQGKQLSLQQLRDISDELASAACTLTSVKLWNAKLGDSGAQLIAQALASNAVVTALDLGGNQIDDLGACALAQGLSNNVTLTTIDLPNNLIGVEGARALAGWLAHTRVARAINLHNNQIGSAGAQAIAQALHRNRSVLSLDVGGNKIGDAGAQAIAAMLCANTALTLLQLGSNEIGAEGAAAIFKAVGVNKGLLSLDLSNNAIGTAGARALAQALSSNAHLAALNLELCKIGDDEADAIAVGLADNTSLAELLMSYNVVGPKGAAALARAIADNSALACIDLACNQVLDEGAVAVAEALAGNRGLTKVTLAYNQIGDTGARAIAGMLAANTTLHYLVLDGNKITHRGAVALVQALAGNTAITMLLLQRNRIDPAARAAHGNVARIQW